jgi:hypothetical protein
VWIRYPEREEILDPTPRIPEELTARVTAHVIASVAYLRGSADTETDTKRLKSVSDTSAEVFHLLSQGRLKEFRNDVEALRQALLRDAETALMVIHFAFKQTGWGRMPFLWHEPIVGRLGDESARIETEWWANKAEDNPIKPATAPPVLTRAPRTETALRIEGYLHKVELETGVKVDKTDFWLSPVKPDGTIRYASDREFRAFQKEDSRLQTAIKKAFNRVFGMPPAKFIEGRDQRRLQLKAKRKKRLHR